MLTYVKKSKLDKVDNTFFTIVKISMEKEDKGETTLPYLLPPSSILLPRRQGDMSKKKFIKKYKKYLETNKGAEFAIFNILKALKNKSSICFTATDDEFKLGYIETLVNYIGDRFGIDVVDIKEATSILKDELTSIDKKNRKLIHKSDDEIDSDKKIKKRDKLIKNIKKIIKSDFGGDDYDTLDKKFAVEQIIWASIDSGICAYSKNTIVDINESKIKKTKPYVMAIILTAENDKVYKKIIKEVLEAQSLKLKEKSLKKLSKTQIVSLCGEIVTKITEYRENN